MRVVRRPLAPRPVTVDDEPHRVARILVESLVALLVVGALLGLGVGFVLSRAVDLLLSIA
jgi:hypothetical protein